MELLEILEKIKSLKAELDKLRPISAEKELRIMQKFRLDWNFHSNNLEGNSLTYGETKALILFGITAQGKPLKDHIEVQGHNEAIKYLTEVIKEERPLTENFIRELHEMLLKEPYESEAITPDGKPIKRWIQIGKYKSTPNHVLTKTGEIFRFATPEETPAMMNELISWYRNNKNKDGINPLWLAAVFHYKFIRIHPFDDGNGRLARILMNFIFMSKEMPPVIIKTDDKGNYFSALQQADSGNIEAFVIYIGDRLIDSLNIMIKGAKGESIEEDGDLDKRLILLEAKLKDREVKKSKSENVIFDLYQEIISPFFHSLESKLDKIDKYFVGKSLRYFINDNISFDSINELDDVFIRKIIKKASHGEVKIGNLRSISFRVFFSEFKHNHINSFSIERGVNFKLSSIKFSILFDKISIDPVIKTYDESFSEDEQKLYINKLLESIIEEIENRVEGKIR